MRKPIHIGFLLSLFLLSACKEHDLGLGLPGEIFEAPSIEEIRPSRGGLEGGTQITIVGSGFASGGRVYVGEDFCGSMLVSSTAIICLTPSSLSEGPVDVRVVNPTNLETTMSNGFTYFATPTVDSVSPSVGNTLGGSVVTLTGSGFQSGSTVKLGGANCAGVTIASSTSLTCTAGAHSAGQVDVTLTTPDSQVASLSNGFLYQTGPTVVSVSPSTGFIAGGIAVTLLGSGFQSGATVAIGGVDCGSVSVASSTSLTCTNGAAGAGTYDVVVTNPDSQSTTYPASFTYAIDGFTQVEQYLGKPNPVGNIDGTGEAARFYGLRGFLTIGGNLYIADLSNHAIRRMDFATGAVTTWIGALGTAGTTEGIGTAARVNGPRGLATDGSFLYVSENHRIRKIDLATAQTSTLAGLAGTAGTADAVGTAARFNTPEGLAILGGTLYVAEVGNHSVRAVDLGTGSVSTFAGLSGTSGSVNGVGGAARFNQPYGITTDGTSLFVGDYANHCVRAITVPGASVTTFAGVLAAAGAANGVGAAARFNGPINVAYDAGLSALHVAEYGGHRLRRIDVGTATVSSIAGTYGATGSINGTGVGARFYNPFGLAVNGTDVYVGDLSSNTVRKVVSASGVVTTASGVDVGWGYVDGNQAQTRFFSPRGMSVYNGDLYAMDYGSCTLRRTVLSNLITSTFAGLAGSCSSSDGTYANARFANGWSLVSDGAGIFFSADTVGQVVRKITVATGDVVTLAGSYGVAGTADGLAGAARFSGPRGLASDGTYLYVADYTNHTIRRVQISDGNTITFAGTAGSCALVNGTGAAARFCNPTDVVYDGTYLYVSDWSNSALRKIDPATADVTTLISTNGFGDGPSSVARITNISAMSYDGTANIYLADYSNHAIRKYNIATDTLSTVFGVPNIGYDNAPSARASAYLRWPWGIHWSPNGLFISNDAGVKRVY